MTNDPPQARLYFNRVVPDPLIEALAPGGPFHSLVELARGHLALERSLDLQLRADGKATNRTRGWATLYVGLTKALDLRFDERKGYRIVPQGQFGRFAETQAGTSPTWASWLPLEKLAAVWADVLAFAEEVIASAAPSHTETEGWMQAALSAQTNGDFTVIDRESQFGFDSAPARRDHHASIKDQLAGLEIQGAWFRTIPRFGGELDALAIDDRGRLLIVEVKPGSSIPSLFWTPAQVTFYHRLFSDWVKQGQAQARIVLEQLAEQRRRIGLVGSPARPLGPHLELVPVIAVGGEVKEVEKANARMVEVWRSIAQAGISDVEPEVWQFDREGDYRKFGLGELRRTAH